MSKQLDFTTSSGDVIVPAAILGFSRLYAVAEDGQVSDNYIGFDIDALRIAQLRDKPKRQLAELETGSAKLRLHEGAGVVLGKPGAGKTLFATTLEQRNPGLVKVIRFREPEADSLLYESSLVAELYTALNSSARVIFIDSLRTTFYASGGSTGKGGVNMGLFATLTAYDIIAQHCGKVLLFALNPMTNDDEAIQFYVEATKGSVSHTMYATEPKKLVVSSRSFTSRDEVRQKYEPLKDAPLEAIAERAPHVVQVPEDSISGLYITTTR